MTEYVLPELDYDYAALEPHISGEIMELHHSKHHATYVAGANSAIEQLAAAREDGTITAKAPLLSKNLAFPPRRPHQSLHLLEEPLPQRRCERPEGELAAAIDEHFGTFDAFVNHFSAVATTLQGSGWAVMAYDTVGQRLVIEQLTDQQGNISIGIIPLLMLDMWEHAFYLQYKNVKADYVKAYWNVINWEDVAQRYATATASTGLIVPA